MDFSDLDREFAPLDFIEFAQHCEMLSDGRLMPRRDDFHLHDVSWLAGRIYQVDVLDGGRDYFFRVFGAFWRDLYGDNLAGRRLSDVEAGSRSFDAMRGQLDRIVIERRPHAGISKLIWPGLVTIVFDRMLVPFTADGETVAQIVVAAHYDDVTEDMVCGRGKALPTLAMDLEDLLPLAS